MLMHVVQIEISLYKLHFRNLTYLQVGIRSWLDLSLEHRRLSLSAHNVLQESFKVRCGEAIFILIGGTLECRLRRRPTLQIRDLVECSRVE